MMMCGRSTSYPYSWELNQDCDWNKVCLEDGMCSCYSIPNNYIFISFIFLRWNKSNQVNWRWSMEKCDTGPVFSFMAEVCEISTSQHLFLLMGLSIFHTICFCCSFSVSYIQSLLAFLKSVYSSIALILYGENCFVVCWTAKCFAFQEYVLSKQWGVVVFLFVCICRTEKER